MLDYLDIDKHKALQSFAESHPDAVLTPVILSNWAKIQLRAEESMHVSMGDREDSEIPNTSSFHKKLVILPDVFRVIFDDGGSLKKWEMLEQYLAQKGFDKNMVELFTNGGEALVFRIKGIEDTVMKVSAEYKLPKVMPFVVKPYSKAVFPMSSFEDPSYLHAVQEYDPENTQKNDHNAQLSGTTGQLSIALSPRLPATYKDILSLGKPDKVSFNHWDKRLESAPGWAVDVAKRVESKLKNEGKIETVRSISIGGLRHFKNIVESNKPFEDRPEKQFELSDTKYNNFGCVAGFQNLPFILDKRCLMVSTINRPKLLHNVQATAIPPSETYDRERDAYYDFMTAIRSVYHDKYGIEDEAFESIAKKSKAYIRRQSEHAVSKETPDNPNERSPFR